MATQKSKLSQNLSVLRSIPISDIVVDLQRRNEAIMKAAEALTGEPVKLDLHLSRQEAELDLAGTEPQIQQKVGGLSLHEAIVSLIPKGRQVSLDELVDLLKKGGYKSKSTNFKIIISQALTKRLSSIFKSRGRGLYQRVK